MTNLVGLMLGLTRELRRLLRCLLCSYFASFDALSKRLSDLDIDLVALGVRRGISQKAERVSN